MRWLLFATILSLPTIATSQAFQSGRWDVTTTVVELAIPGVPGFLQRMARGHASIERKALTAGQGIAALLAPDPKAQCAVDGQLISDGRYRQALTCPQKRGAPMHISRSGTYDGFGFVGQATITGTTSKGALRMVLDQHASRIGD